jgi:hypothetical protein
VARNITDAQERMGVLKTTTGRINRYSPGLIVLTWEDEALEDLGERVSDMVSCGARTDGTISFRSQTN